MKNTKIYKAQTFYEGIHPSILSLSLSLSSQHTHTHTHSIYNFCLFVCFFAFYLLCLLLDFGNMVADTITTYLFLL